MTLREPKEIEIECQDGAIRTFIISKLPAIAGRKMVTQYPLTASPKIGEYSKNEELMVELLSYTAIKMTNGSMLQLTTRALIENHVPDWEALARLEKAMAEYNISFFPKGKPSDLLDALFKKLITSLTPMLTRLLQSLFPNGLPPSAN